MTAIAPSPGTIAGELYTALDADRYGGWREAFGDDFAPLCERIEDEVVVIFNRRRAEDAQHIRELESQVTSIEEALEGKDAEIEARDQKIDRLELQLEDAKETINRLEHLDLDGVIERLKKATYGEFEDLLKAKDLEISALRAKLEFDFANLGRTPVRL